MAITTINGASSTDATSIIGTALADTIVVDSDNLYLDAKAGGDTITTAETYTSVSLIGGDANDSISLAGGLQKGFIRLDKGNDTFTVAKEFDGAVYGGRGTDSFTFSKSVTSSTVQGDHGNDTITASGSVTGSLFNGGLDDDNITIVGSLTKSSIYGGKQADTIGVSSVVTSLVSGDKANDSINLNGGVLTDATIQGGDGKDTITIASAITAASNTTVFGGEGNDSIDQLDNNAIVLDGGAGNDDIQADTAAKHTIFGGAGNDTIDTSSSTKAVVLDGGADNDTITGGSGKDSIVGGTGNDSINSGAGNDTIQGGAGKDTVTLAGGNDFINLGADNDSITLTTGDAAKLTIYGGKGDDSITYDAATDLTNEDLVSGDSGTDVLILSTAAAAVADEDFSTVTTVEKFAITGAVSALTHVFGAKAQTAGIVDISLAAATTAASTIDASGYTTSVTLTASTANLADTLKGGSAADTFNTGVAGAVNMTGAGGNDTFNITSAGAVAVTDLSGADILKVGSGTGGTTATVTANYTATASSTNNLSVAGAALTATKDAKIDMTAAGNFYGYTLNAQVAAVGTGNGSSITGSSKADAIVGNTGKDTLLGGEGADTINGAGGIDNLSGGGGNDTFAITTTGTQLATDTVAGGTGTDRFLISADVAGMAATFDMDTISDVLSFVTVDATDNNNDDVTLTFSAVTETTAQTVSIDASSMTNGGGDLAVVNSSAKATTTFSVVGSAGADTIAGGIGNDTVSGGAAVDSITGGAGNDSLTGGEAADSITGGDGADQIILTETTAAIDVVIYATGSSDTLTTIAGTGNSGTISGFDSITGFNVGTTDTEKDQLKYGATAIITDTTADLTTATTLTVGSATLKSFDLSNKGLATFDDQTSYAAAVTLVGQGGLAAAAQALISQDLGNAGTTAVFNVTGSDGFEGAYVYQQTTANSGATAGDAYSLTRLEGITSTGVELAASTTANLVFVD